MPPQLIPFLIVVAFYFYVDGQPQAEHDDQPDYEPLEDRSAIALQYQTEWDDWYDEKEDYYLETEDYVSEWASWPNT